NPGVVDEDVQAAESPERFLDHGIMVLLSGDIDMNKEDALATGVELACRLLSLGVIYIGNHHAPGPRSQERFGASPSYPARRAGDDCNPGVKRHEPENSREPGNKELGTGNE